MRFAATLLLAASSLVVACDRPIKLTEDALVTVDVLAPADLANLPPTAIVFATIEIPGALAETRLNGEDGGRFTSQLSLGIPERITPIISVRIYAALDATTQTALVWIAELPTEIQPGAEVNIGAEVAFKNVPDELHPYLDLNRNGRDNLGDLLLGCDPAVPPPFVRISTTDVQLDANLIDRQVVVVDNLVGREVTVRADVIDALGVGVAVIEPGAEQAVALPTTDERVLGPGESIFLALSFEPANASLTTGVLAIESVDSVAGEEELRCNTRSAEPVRIVANSGGAPSRPRPGDVLPALDVNASLQGFEPSAVEAFPLENVASGTPLGVELNPVPSGQLLGGKAADRVFLVEIPRGARAAIAATGAAFDVDVAIFKLDDGDALGVELPRGIDGTVTGGLPGTSAEVADIVADAHLGADEAALRILVALGASGATEARLLEEEVAAVQLVAHVVTVPRFTGQSVASGPVGGGTVVELSGNGLDPDGEVRFGGVIAACSALPDAQPGVRRLACTSPAGSLQVGKNPVDVVYRTPDGVATAALVQGFLYVPETPLVTAVEPGFVSTAGGEALTIRGFGFTDRYGAITVRVDGEARPAGVIDEQTIVSTAPPHAAGAVDVSVTILGPDLAPLTGTLSDALVYGDPPPPPPRLDSVSPPLGATTGGEQVTILGAGFQSDLDVTIGGAEAFVVAVGATAIVAVTPPGAPGAADVVVTNPDARTDTLVGGFVYFDPPAPTPLIFAVTPSRGDVAGGTEVTILGQSFDANATVRFGGATATVTNASSGALTVLSPPGAGVVDVTVQNADGQLATATNAFRYEAPVIAPPVIFAVTPGEGDVAGGTPLTLLGESFSANPIVRIDGVAVDVANAAATAITVVTAPHAPALVAVSVENEDGQSDTLPNAFRFVDGGGVVLAPVIVDVVPDQAHALVGFETITLLGDDLETTQSAVIEDGAQTIPATITQLSSALVELLVDEPLPAGVPLVVALTQGDSSIVRSPSFTAVAPAPLSVTANGLVEEGSSFTLIITGANMNPTKLTALRFTPLDAGSGTETDLAPGFKAETVTSVTVPDNTLGRGGWTVSLVYGTELVVPVDVLEVGGPCPGSALCDTCGDGIRDPGEQCDRFDFGAQTCEGLGFDGGQLSCVGCQIDAVTCTVCGNSIRETGEQCDSNDLAGQSCTSLGFTAGTLACRNDCTLNSTQCTRCGDGVCSGNETSASCAADCPATCGDTTCNNGELCSTCPRDCNLCAPYNMILLSGGGSATITATLQTEVRVRIVDDDGLAVPNVTVTFTPEPGDVTTFATRITDANGEAGVSWSLGPRVGEHALAIAATSPDGTTINNQPINVSATATDIAPGTIITLAGDGDAVDALVTFGQGNAGIRTSLGATIAVAVLPLDPNEPGDVGDVLVLSSDRCELFELDMPNGVLTRLIGQANGANNCSLDSDGGEGDGQSILVNGGPNPAVKIRGVQEMLVGADGAIFLTEDPGGAASDLVRRIDPLTREINTVAGGGPTGQPGNGVPGPARQAHLDGVRGLAFAADGDLLISEATRDQVTRVDFSAGVASAAISVLLTLPATALDGNGVSGTKAAGSLTGPVVVVEEAPLLYVASFAINRTGFGADSLAVCDATLCQMVSGLNANEGVFRGPDGLFYSARNAGSRIDRYDGIAGTSVIVGTGVQGFSGDRGPATAAQVQIPRSLAFFPNGDLVFVDDRNTVRLVRAVADTPANVTLTKTAGDAQTVNIFAQTPQLLQAQLLSNGAPSQNTFLTFTPPSGGAVAVSAFQADAGGFVASQVFAARFVDVEGTTREQAFTMQLIAPLSRLYPTAQVTFSVTATQPATQTFTSTFTGTTLISGAAAASRQLFNVSAVDLANSQAKISIDGDGTFFVAADQQQRVWRVDPSGVATTFAGTGVSGSLGDGGLATNAQVAGPCGTALADNGDLFIADRLNHRIRRVDQNGLMSTIAGNGSGIDNGDGGPASAATIRTPRQIAFAGDGTLYIMGDAQMRRIDPAGNIHLVARGGNFDCLGAGTAWELHEAAVAVSGSPTGEVFAGILTDVGAGCPVGQDGAYIVEVVDGAFQTPPLFFDNCGGTLDCRIHSLTVRDDGVIFFIFEPQGTALRQLKARLTDGSVVDVAGAPTNGHQVTVGPDGMLYIVDQPADQIRVFNPGL